MSSRLLGPPFMIVLGSCRTPEQREASRAIVSVHTRTQTTARPRLIPRAFMPGFGVPSSQGLGRGLAVTSGVLAHRTFLRSP